MNITVEYLSFSEGEFCIMCRASRPCAQRWHSQHWRGEKTVSILQGKEDGSNLSEIKGKPTPDEIISYST
jgi:hypothetical protein